MQAPAGIQVLKLSVPTSRWQTWLPRSSSIPHVLNATNSRSNVSPADWLDPGQTMFCRTGVELPDRHLGSSSRHLNQPPPLLYPDRQVLCFQQAGGGRKHTHTLCTCVSHILTDFVSFPHTERDAHMDIHAHSHVINAPAHSCMHNTNYIHYNWSYTHTHTHMQTHTRPFHISQAGFPDISCGDNHVYCAVCKLNSVPNSHTRHRAS